MTEPTRYATPETRARELVEVILDGIIQSIEEHGEKITTAQSADRIVATLVHNGLLVTPDFLGRLAVAEDAAFMLGRAPKGEGDDGAVTEECYARWARATGPQGIEAVRGRFTPERRAAFVAATRARREELFAAMLTGPDMRTHAEREFEERTAP